MARSKWYLSEKQNIIRSCKIYNDFGYRFDSCDGASRRYVAVVAMGIRALEYN